VYEGFTVPIYYDPLIAKLLVWAPTRTLAIDRMKRALAEYTIQGVKTSIPFHVLVMNNERFVQGNYDTTFIDRVLGGVQYEKHHQDVAAIVAVIQRITTQQQASKKKPSTGARIDAWKMAGRRSMLRGK
jgi:acetyl-CoA carboxylase biotin carboxylase subunit